MHARGSSSRCDGGARASFCRDTFVALCASLLNLPGLIWTIELLIVERLLAHVVTPHKFVRLTETSKVHLAIALHILYKESDFTMCLFIFPRSSRLRNHDTHARNIDTHG